MEKLEAQVKEFKGAADDESGTRVSLIKTGAIIFQSMTIHSSTDLV